MRTELEGNWLELMSDEDNEKAEWVSEWVSEWVGFNVSINKL